jgi:predicted N-acetyltransferase YhbS
VVEARFDFFGRKSSEIPCMQSAIITRAASPHDIAAINALQARVFGPGRFARSAYRVREGKGVMSRFCRVADGNGRLIATLRITEISIGAAGGAALLGPLAVDPEYRGQGYGRKLVAEALVEMQAAGLAIVVLVGDEPYYARFGFKPVPMGAISFPGPVNPDRILAAELKPGALANYCGLVTAAALDGGPDETPDAAGAGKA